MLIPRSDKSIIGKWWWEVDKILLSIMLLFFLISFVISLVAANYVQYRFNIDAFTLVYKHLFFIFISITTMLALALLPIRYLSQFMVIFFFLSLVALVFVLFFGEVIKGSRRWLELGFVSLQPSEFFKPTFIFFVALLLYKAKIKENFSNYYIAVLIFAVYAILLWQQPDIGQIIILGIVFIMMIFVSGMTLFNLFMICLFLLSTFAYAYFQFAHVRLRLDSFINEFSFFSVEVEKFGGQQSDFALKSIMAGGWFGKGPGEGVYKKFLPDAYSDFVFAIFVEEFGAIFAIALLGLILFFVFRIWWKILCDDRIFHKICLGGMSILFCLQTLLNVAVNLALVPTKGITLPIFSYGGSSMLSFAVLFGVVLALTRGKKYVATTTKIASTTKIAGTTNVSPQL